MVKKVDATVSYNQVQGLHFTEGSGGKLLLAMRK